MGDWLYSGDIEMNLRLTISLLLPAAFMLVLRLRPLKLKSLLVVVLGALLYALAGTSVALAGHHREPGTRVADASLLLFMGGQGGSRCGWFRILLGLEQEKETLSPKRSPSRWPWGCCISSSRSGPSTRDPGAGTRSGVDPNGCGTPRVPVCFPIPMIHD